MSGKTLYTIVVLIVYALLIGLYFYFVKKQYELCKGPCVRFCDTVNNSDEFILENFRLNNRDYTADGIKRGTPKCHGGLKCLAKFSDNDTNPFEIVRSNEILTISYIEY